MSGHPQHYLTEFHKTNSENCLKDLEKSKELPLTIEDVLEQSYRQGRSTISEIIANLQKNPN